MWMMTQRLKVKAICAEPEACGAERIGVYVGVFLLVQDGGRDVGRPGSILLRKGADCPGVETC